jgi:hypothetical protein
MNIHDGKCWGTAYCAFSFFHDGANSPNKINLSHKWVRFMGYSTPSQLAFSSVVADFLESE